MDHAAQSTFFWWEEWLPIKKNTLWSDIFHKFTDCSKSFPSLVFTSNASFRLCILIRSRSLLSNLLKFLSLAEIPLFLRRKGWLPVPRSLSLSRVRSFRSFRSLLPRPRPTPPQLIFRLGLWSASPVSLGCGPVPPSLPELSDISVTKHLTLFRNLPQ